MTFKALTNRLPDYVQNFFTRCENSNYSLRSNNVKPSLPKPRTNFLKRSFSYGAAHGWNELSDEVTNNIQDLSLPDFKWRLIIIIIIIIIVFINQYSKHTSEFTWSYKKI